MIDWVSPDSIAPASYNPREISDDDFDSLCCSLRRLGVVMPIIVNRRNRVIIAGHQRQKAARAIGLAEVPVMWADNVSLSDEVLFNQIHNGTDFDKGLSARIDAQEGEGFVAVPPEQNHARCERRVVVQEVCKLIERYGNVLSCISTHAGEVFKAPAYAEACRVLNIPANVYVMPDVDVEFAKQAFGGSYGVFSYEHIEKRTWVQGLAQLSRRVDKGKADGTESKRTAKSRLYERLVIPNLRKDERALDFGAGKGQYAAMLRRRGYDIDSLEFYHNNRKGINVSAAKRDIERLLARLNDGLMDAVICDSVLNSVDSQEAERSVVGTCSALLRMGGTLYVSGRPASTVERKLRHTRQASNKREMYFLDANGLSATFRKGNFYYQKFHTDEQVSELMAEHGFRIESYDNDGSGWRLIATKVAQSPHAESGVLFEFDLPYPGGSYGCGETMLEAIRSAGSPV